MTIAIHAHQPKENRFVMFCDYCGASKDEAFILISSPNGNHICDQCVDVCVAVVKQKREENQTMTTTKTDAQKFQNALRIMYSLDEVSSVLPRDKFVAFHMDPIGVSMRMDADTWAKVYELIEARQ